MRDSFNEINITPLTDIFLVLLIIMMVIAPMLDQQGLNLAVPEVVDAEQIKNDSKIMTVIVTSDNKIVFFIGALREGGAERVISIISNKLVECGKNAEILLYYDSEDFYDINPKIKIIKAKFFIIDLNSFENTSYILTKILVLSF